MLVERVEVLRALHHLLLELPLGNLRSRSPRDRVDRFVIRAPRGFDGASTPQLQRKPLLGKMKIRVNREEARQATPTVRDPIHHDHPEDRHEEPLQPALVGSRLAVLPDDLPAFRLALTPERRMILKESPHQFTTLGLQLPLQLALAQPHRLLRHQPLLDPRERFISRAKDGVAGCRRVRWGSHRGPPGR